MRVSHKLVAVFLVFWCLEYHKPNLHSLAMAFVKTLRLWLQLLLSYAFFVVTSKAIQLGKSGIVSGPYIVEFVDSFDSVRPPLSSLTVPHQLGTYCFCPTCLSDLKFRQARDRSKPSTALADWKIELHGLRNVLEMFAMSIWNRESGRTTNLSFNWYEFLRLLTPNSRVSSPIPQAVGFIRHLAGLSTMPSKFWGYSFLPSDLIHNSYSQLYSIGVLGIWKPRKSYRSIIVVLG